MKQRTKGYLAWSGFRNWMKPIGAMEGSYKFEVKADKQIETSYEVSIFL